MSAMRAYDFTELVTRGVESDELDYKAAMNWNTMSRAAKGKIARHLTAFANVRGGFLVIGVGESSSGVPDQLTGVSEEEAASFDPTPVGNFLNAHIEPELDFTIDRPLINGKRFVIFSVRPFTTLPHICSKGVENELQEGVFYIRTAEASSRPARRALEMQRILRRCMRNEREQLGRVLRGILYESRSLPASDQQKRFPDLAADAENFFRRRKSGIANMVMLKFFVIPDTILPPQTPNKYPDLLTASAFLNRNAAFFTAGELASGKRAANSYRMLSPERPAMWQFFDSGMFISFQGIPRQEFTLEKLSCFCAEAVAFVSELLSELCGGEELFTLKTVITAAPPPELFHAGDRFSPGSSEISAEICRSAADLASGRENHAVRLIRRLGENFKLPDSLLDRMEPAVKNFLERR